MLWIASEGAVPIAGNRLPVLCEPSFGFRGLSHGLKKCPPDTFLPRFARRPQGELLRSRREGGLGHSSPPLAPEKAPSQWLGAFSGARGGTRKAVKKTCRWHVFRPWESPRKPNDGSQRTGRRFPAIGTAPSDAIHNKSELDHVPSQGRSTIRPKNTPIMRAIRESPLRCYYKTVRKIGICLRIYIVGGGALDAPFS